MLFVKGRNLNDIPNLQYLNIFGQTGFFSSKVKIKIDIGDSSVPDIIEDANGKAIKFRSMIHAMNALHVTGWNLKTTYAISEDGNGVYHHIFERRS